MARQIMPAAPCYVIPLNCSTLESKRGLKMDHLIKAKKIAQIISFGNQKAHAMGHGPIVVSRQNTSKNESM